MLVMFEFCHFCGHVSLIVGVFRVTCHLGPAGRADKVNFSKPVQRICRASAYRKINATGIPQQHYGTAMQSVSSRYVHSGRWGTHVILNLVLAFVNIWRWLVLWGGLERRGPGGSPLQGLTAKSSQTNNFEKKCQNRVSVPQVPNQMIRSGKPNVRKPK